MSSSSISAIMKQVEAKIQEGNNMPSWLDRLLGKKFFDKCPAHRIQPNDLNRYCITCDETTCKTCLTAGFHKGHKWLSIYRHVYQDVIPKDELVQHIDCDKIQPYKCNKRMVFSLAPLPHNGSGSLINGDGACHICKRKLTDPDEYRFCSISCKVQALTPYDGIRQRKPKGGTSQNVPKDRAIQYQVPGVRVIQHNARDDEAIQDREPTVGTVKEDVLEVGTSQRGDEAEKPVQHIGRKRSRKGVPHRAPFF